MTRVSYLFGLGRVHRYRCCHQVSEPLSPHFSFYSEPFTFHTTLLSSPLEEPSHPSDSSLEPPPSPACPEVLRSFALQSQILSTHDRGSYVTEYQRETGLGIRKSLSPIPSKFSPVATVEREGWLAVRWPSLGQCLESFDWPGRELGCGAQPLESQEMGDIFGVVQNRASNCRRSLTQRGSVRGLVLFTSAITQCPRRPSLSVPRDCFQGAGGPQALRCSPVCEGPQKGTAHTPPPHTLSQLRVYFPFLIA